MDRTWFRTRERAVSGAYGIPLEGQLPMPMPTGSSPLRRSVTTKRSWWATGARIARNAVIAVAMMALVPVAIVAVQGSYFANAIHGMGVNTRTRMTAAEPVRAFRVAPDASITPMQAGLALNALQYRHLERRGFEAIEPAVRPARPWRTNPIAPDMFVTARSGLYDGPSSQSILEAVAKGFTPREQAYLRELAEADVWREFDIVARASAVDVVGGQFSVPFGQFALPEARPLPSFKDSKELAYAAVSRAAYYMSIGRPQEAEQVLRSIVSFGFTFVDNGTTTLEELIGTVIVGIGRDALQRFYVLQHDPRASLPALASPPRSAAASSRSSAVVTVSDEEVRRWLLARLADPAVPRPERFESVQALTYLSCTNVRDLMFGQRRDVDDAITRARTTLARYPSERALVELESRLPTATSVTETYGPLQSLAVSSATVAGVVLHNPRMAACTRILTSGW